MYAPNVNFTIAQIYFFSRSLSFSSPSQTSEDSWISAPRKTYNLIKIFLKKEKSRDQMTNKMLLPLHIYKNICHQPHGCNICIPHAQTTSLLHLSTLLLPLCLPLNFQRKIYINVPILIFRDSPESRTPWLLHEEGGNK